MRVLVTGASGFIGASVCRYLTNAGMTVRINTRTTGLGKHLQKIGLAHEVHVGDLRDTILISGIAKDCDVVMHFADDRHVHSKTVQEVSVDGTFNLIEEVKKEPSVSNVIFTSSMAVYGPNLHNLNLFDPTSELGELQPFGDPYSDSKLGAERVLQEFAAQGGPAVTILRLSPVYGIGSRAWTRVYVTNAKRNQLRTYGTGDYIFRYLHIDSAVAAIMCSLKAQGFNVYNVYDGVTTVNEFLQHYANMFDPPRQIKRVPLWLVKFMFTLAGLMPGAVMTPQTLIPMTEPVADNKFLIPCNRIAEDLGWYPRVDINVAMQDIKRYLVDGIRPGTSQEEQSDT